MDVREDTIDSIQQDLEVMRLLDEMEPYPKAVKRRIKALKKIQAECNMLEGELNVEIHMLEKKYLMERYQDGRQKRKDIVIGTYEPTDEESDWMYDDLEEIPVAEDDSVKIETEIEDGAQKNDKDNKLEIVPGVDSPHSPEPETATKGVPGFWVKIFENVEVLRHLTRDHDWPVLTFLEDIAVELLDSGFQLNFQFAENPFFEERLLTKTYDMMFMPGEKPFDRLMYDGPEIVASRGCEIHWRSLEADVTKRIVQRRQRHKRSHEVRVVTETQEQNSFFNFFSPPEAPSMGAAIDEDLQEQLHADFEIGQFLRENICRCSVLYYTGDAIDPEDFGGEGEEEEEYADDQGNPAA